MVDSLIYRNDEGVELICSDANHVSLAERYGFTLVGPYVEEPAKRTRKPKTEE